MLANVNKRIQDSMSYSNDLWYNEGPALQVTYIDHYALPSVCPV